MGQLLGKKHKARTTNGGTEMSTFQFPASHVLDTDTDTEFPELRRPLLTLSYKSGPWNPLTLKPHRQTPASLQLTSEAPSVPDNDRRYSEAVVHRRYA